MAYDPTYEACVLDVLTALDPQAGDAQLSYVDRLRRLQGVLTDSLQTGVSDVTADEQNAVMQALGRLDPHADDAQHDHQTRLRRLQGAIDRELSRWTSASVQPAGPSGETAVAAPQQTT